MGFIIKIRFYKKESENMYERFLVPVDGSEHSKHALKSANWLAQNVGMNASHTLEADRRTPAADCSVVCC